MTDSSAYISGTIPVSTGCLERKKKKRERKREKEMNKRQRVVTGYTVETN